MSRSVSAPSSVTNTSPCWNGLIVPGSTLMYGSSLRLVTRMPREVRIAASDAAAMPFPNEETTPPVTKTNLVMGDKFRKFPFYPNLWSRTNDVLCESAAQAFDRALTADERQHGVDRRGLRFAGDQSPCRHHELRGFQAALCGDRLDRRTDRLAGPVGALERRQKLGQGGSDGIGHHLGELDRDVCRVRRVRVEVVRGIGHFRQRRRSVAQQLGDACRRRAGCDVEPGTFEKRSQPPAELIRRETLDVLVINPRQLVRIEPPGRR